jgi:hypothetical protein
MQNQLRAATTASAAAQRGADAARRAVGVAEQTLITTDRPWVGIQIEVGDVLTVSDDTYTAQIIVTLSNYGRSPAVAASCFIELLHLGELRIS